MHTQCTTLGRLVVIRLDSGDDILQSIRAACAQHGVKHGVILGAIGSIRTYHVHVVATADLPPRDVFLKGEGSFDILSLTGLILDGRVHGHIAFANADKAIGGHMEEGCCILTFSVVTLVETPQADLTGWDRIGRLVATQ